MENNMFWIYVILSYIVGFLSIRYISKTQETCKDNEFYIFMGLLFLLSPILFPLWLIGFCCTKLLYNLGKFICENFRN